MTANPSIPTARAADDRGAQRARSAGEVGP